MRPWRVLVGALTALGLFVVAPAAQAPSPGSLVDLSRASLLKRRADERIAALTREAEALGAETRTLLGDLRRLQIEQELHAERLQVADAAVRDGTEAYDHAVTDADALEIRVARERPIVEARLAQMYKMGRIGYTRLLFDTGRSKDFARTYRVMSMLAHDDRERFGRYQQDLADLDLAKSTLRTKNAELAAARDEVAAALDALRRTVAARTTLLASLNTRRQLALQLADEMRQARARLDETLDGLEGSDAGTAGLPVRPFHGALPWPARGRVTGTFGRERDRKFRTETIRNGVEIAVPAGSIARAVHEGRVAFAEPFAGFGQLVIVDHGGQVYSLYGQLASVGVKRGERVDAGALIGRTGATARGASVLYFELRVDGKPVDPLQWLAKDPG